MSINEENNIITLKNNSIQYSNNSNHHSNQNQGNRRVQFNDDDHSIKTELKLMDEIVEVGDGTLKKDNFAENNVSIRNIIDNALFSQLSEIKIKLLDMDENVSNRLYKKEGKILPKIDYIEFSLLNQSVNI